MFNIRGIVEQLLKSTDMPLYVPCDCLEHAIAIVRHFIEINYLGGGNFTGGRIVDTDFNFIAQVSYNGRVWATDNKEIPTDLSLFNKYYNQLL